MEVDDLMRRAWEAVKSADVPEPLQEAAFKEAVAFLREAEGASGQRDSGGVAPGRTSLRRAAAPKGSTKPTKGTADQGVTRPDDATFFSRLANESGVGQKDLQDILRLTKDGKVHVTPATRNLGSSTAEQATIVIALVSGARAIGLEEDPVDAGAVREEAKRKRCFDSGNFAKSLTRMKGFNAGSNRNEIVLTSRWVEEFKAAVDKALGRGPTKDEAGSS